MSAPTWTRFSNVSKPPQKILEDASDLFLRHKLRPREMARLVRTERGKIELDESSLVKIRTDEEALAHLQDWDGLAIAYNVLSIGATIYLYFWSIGPDHGTALQTDTQIPYLEWNEMAEGEWLERFLVAYTAATSAAVSGYGRCYPIAYEPLVPGTVAHELRDGTLVRRKFESFHMISTQLVTDEDVATALALEGRMQRLRHFRTTTGYHVLSSIVTETHGG